MPDEIETDVAEMIDHMIMDAIQGGIVERQTKQQFRDALDKWLIERLHALGVPVDAVPRAPDAPRFPQRRGPDALTTRG